jgi:beta-glucanase (GH16 family)
MMNLWPGTGVDSWLGPFTYTGPITAQYDSVQYTAP